MRDDLGQLSRGQFNISNIWQKKLVETTQANDATHVDRHQEGMCFWCEKRTFVSATLIDACYDCVSKKPLNSLIAIAARKMYGFCFLHGGYCKLRYKNNCAQINVRLCMRCMRRVRSCHEYLRKEGERRVDPYYLWLRKHGGKDWEVLMRAGGGSVRR